MNFIMSLLLVIMCVLIADTVIFGTKLFGQSQRPKAQRKSVRDIAKDAFLLHN